ncbi:cysteine sulfinic acid decarboxylase-like [Diadema setosum]|uniref:cysteine sulfinic acid decarboxylase-like n=1 Tax=Diadema setosum TaxID=31175 RepID=UPI003B3A4E44
MTYLIHRSHQSFNTTMENHAVEYSGTLMASKRSEEVEFLAKVFALILEEGIRKPLSGECKVVDFKHPEDLKASFDFKIRDEPETSQRLLDLCQETFNYSVKTAHPQYYDTNFNGQDPYGLAASWMTDVLNTSQYTFEVGPVFVLMESETLGKLRRLCGFESGDGIFCPGGSLANMFAVNLARHKLDPNFRAKGNYHSAPLKIFVSDQGHYSFQKGAAFMGIGTENVVIVKTDERGKMIPEELEKAIVSAKEQGEIPLLVAATAGTTVLGSYDPIDSMADICSRHGIWLHVDAAWGGSALVSRTHRHLLHGIHRVNSVTWCLHKMMGVPFQCSSFLVNGNETLMKECMSAHAQYLFQQDKFYDMSYDTGDKTLQCGRKVDVFKLWLMWRAKGNLGFEAEIDQKFAVSRHLAKLVRETEGFELVQEPECTNICFWYIPKCLRGQERTPEYWQRLHKVAPAIKEAMTIEGSMLITYQPNGTKVNFFKVGVGNARMTNDSIAKVIEEVDRLGRDIQV